MKTMRREEETSTDKTEQGERPENGRSFYAKNFALVEPASGFSSGLKGVPLRGTIYSSPSRKDKEGKVAWARFTRPAARGIEAKMVSQNKITNQMEVHKMNMKKILIYIVKALAIITLFAVFVSSCEVGLTKSGW